MNNEKYKEYFNMIRFNQQVLNNIFKFYFVMASLVVTFLGLILKPIVQKYYNGTMEAADFSPSKAGIPQAVISVIRPFHPMLLWMFFFMLVLGGILFLSILATRYDTVWRIRELNKGLGNWWDRIEMDTKPLSFGNHWVYFSGCALFNTISYVLIMVIGNAFLRKGNSQLMGGYRFSFFWTLVLHIVVYVCAFLLIDKGKLGWKLLGLFLGLVSLCIFFPWTWTLWQIFNT